MPLVMNKAEWNRIVNWTGQDKEDPEVVRRREYVRYLDKESNKMTKDWPNSLENVNKRNEELRLARIQAAEQSNSKFYKRYVKRKKEEQERLMYSARDTIFKNKDAPKLMLSAVIESVIQKERAEQLKFIEEIRRQALEQKRKDDQDIIQKAKEWQQLMKLKKKRRFDVNKQHQIDILEQAHEVSEKKRIEYETELNMQQIDIQRAEQEMGAIKDYEELFNKEEKKRILHDMQQSRLEADRRAVEEKARDELDDKLLQVLQKSRARTEATRKKTEKEIQAEKLRVLEKISQKLECGDAERGAREQANLDRAIGEKVAATEARAKAQEDKQKRFRQDRIDTRTQFLRDEARRLQEFNNIRQWEIMNRFKNGELYDDFKEKQRAERERKIKEYREDILKLWKERQDREARELAETRHFYGELAERKVRAADNKLLAHAALLVREAEAEQRPARPLLRAVDQYCKLYRLYPMPPLPASMAEHFGGYGPRDHSQPDAGYSPEAPPGAAGQRDGLQDVEKAAEPSKPIPKTEMKSDDYKRQGKANGLQRNQNQHNTEGILPPIKVLPCQAPCGCDLKNK